jgi:hypothetical protein
VIKAQAWSDDHNVEVEFDAAPWFAQAADLDILKLAYCDWRGDYPADIVAEFMADDVADLAFLFRYLQTIAGDPLKKDQGGFECAVQAGPAMAWLKRDRPALAAAIDKMRQQDLMPERAVTLLPKEPHTNKLKDFEVRLTRTTTRCCRIGVKAPNETDARSKALDQAGDLDFFAGSESEPVYDADEIQEVIR